MELQEFSNDILIQRAKKLYRKLIDFTFKFEDFKQEINKRGINIGRITKFSGEIL